MTCKIGTNVPFCERWVELEPSQLGEIVRSKRKEHMLKQSELAMLAEVSERFIREVEKGKPSVQLDKVLKVLGVLGLRLEVVPNVVAGL